MTYGLGKAEEGVMEVMEKWRQRGSRCMDIGMVDEWMVRIEQRGIEAVYKPPPPQHDSI